MTLEINQVGAAVCDITEASISLLSAVERLRNIAATSSDMSKLLFEDIWIEYCKEYRGGHSERELCENFFGIIERQLSAKLKR